MIFTTDIIVVIHQRIIEDSGGTSGIRDPNRLDAAVNQIYQTYGGKDL